MAMDPGQLFFQEEPIICNEGRDLYKLKVTNTGDRPIQVGSHYHFYEVNESLTFDREDAYGKRLNIPAGAAVRFVPGDEKEVELGSYGGERKVYGFNNKTDGSLERG